jgi:hypothetical protein
LNGVADARIKRRVKGDMLHGMTIKTAEEYRKDARRVRELAQKATSVSVQTALLEVAATYDDLALQAERLARMGYSNSN